MELSESEDFGRAIGGCDEGAAATESTGDCMGEASVNGDVLARDRSGLVEGEGAGLAASSGDADLMLDMLPSL